MWMNRNDSGHFVEAHMWCDSNGGCTCISGRRRLTPRCYRPWSGSTLLGGPLYEKNCRIVQSRITRREGRPLPGVASRSFPMFENEPYHAQIVEVIRDLGDLSGDLQPRRHRRLLTEETVWAAPRRRIPTGARLSVSETHQSSIRSCILLWHLGCI